MPIIAYLTLHRAMPAPPSHPLFINNPDGSFTREHVPCDLRAHASHCGLYPAQVSSHGLRIGSAWTMANEGVPIATIQVLGRWKCDLMPLLYCRMSLDRLALATRAFRLSTANVHVELYPPSPTFVCPFVLSRAPSSQPPSPPGVSRSPGQWHVVVPHPLGTSWALALAWGGPRAAHSIRTR